MKKIAIEEHFFTEEHLNCLHSLNDYPRQEIIEDEKHGKMERMWRSPVYSVLHGPEINNKLLDFGSIRLAEMDKAGIQMQVLSLSSIGVDEIDVAIGTGMAKKVNNELAKVTEKYPDRFAGFAAIAPGDPQGAANELERAVKQLGLKGAQINSHGRGEYLDDKKYWVIFETAEKLGVPIYIHPKDPPPDMLKPFTTYPILSAAMWGFFADGGLHAMRLICSGLFDVYPRLKIILGHLGETIPFCLWRIDNRWLRSRGDRDQSSSTIKRKYLKKNPGDYFRDNFFVTTSGMFWEPAFLCTYMALGADKILFAVDYPYESSEEATKFIESVPICESDKEKICHLNAEKLLSL